MLTQSCCTYQKFCVVSAQTSCVLRPSPTEPHLFQPSQGWLNEPRPSEARSDYTSQMNRALGFKRARARLRLPSVSTPLFSRIPHTRVSTRLHTHSAALGPVIVLYSEGACYNVMIEALDSEHNLFFYNY